MKKIFGLIAVGAIAFGIISASASSLTLQSVKAPEQGPLTITGLGCGATPATSASLIYDDPLNPTAVSGIDMPVTCTTTPGSWVVVNGTPSNQFSSLAADYSTGTGILRVTFNPVGITAFGPNSGTNKFESITVTALP